MVLYKDGIQKCNSICSSSIALSSLNHLSYVRKSCQS